MKLILINNTGLKAYHFSSADSQRIKEQCKAAKKTWSDHLLGFFIHISNGRTYAAITIKDQSGLIESMEYVDIEQNIPEFPIDNNLLTYLSTKEANTEVELDKFDSLLSEIIFAPQKARRWEVYPEISKLYLGH